MAAMAVEAGQWQRARAAQNGAQSGGCKRRQTPRHAGLKCMHTHKPTHRHREGWQTMPVWLQLPTLQDGHALRHHDRGPRSVLQSRDRRGEEREAQLQGRGRPSRCCAHSTGSTSSAGSGS